MKERNIDTSDRKIDKWIEKQTVADLQSQLDKTEYLCQDSATQNSKMIKLS